MSWTIASAIDIGSRAEQQDRISVLSSRHDDGRLVVVADGMGGHLGGAEAAQQVIETAARLFGGGAVGAPRTFLETVCLSAHRKIQAVGRRNRSSPGSTCTLLYLTGAEAYWMHVGDSRLYHFAGGDLKACTEDHSLAALVARERGEAAGSSAPVGLSGQLYMCLGGKNRIAPQYGASALGRDDWFMLCTDGFWSMVSPQEAARVVTAGGSLGDIAAGLVDLARQRGGAGADNISLVLAHRQSRSGRWRRLIRRRSPRVTGS